MSGVTNQATPQSVPRCALKFFHHANTLGIEAFTNDREDAHRFYGGVGGIDAGKLPRPVCLRVPIRIFPGVIEDDQNGNVY